MWTTATDGRRFHIGGQGASPCATIIAAIWRSAVHWHLDGLALEAWQADREGAPGEQMSQGDVTAGSERHMFVLALSRTNTARRTNGPYVQLSVEMCSECGALVAEDQMPLHEAFHASLRDAR
jgi:hypothetical protein